MTDSNDDRAATAAVVPESAGAHPMKQGMPRSTRILAITAGGVLAAGAVFGGGVAFGTSLNSGTTGAAQQGQFGGTSPNGTMPTGAPPGSGTGTNGSSSTSG